MLESSVMRVGYSSLRRDIPLSDARTQVSQHLFRRSDDERMVQIPVHVETFHPSTGHVVLRLHHITRHAEIIDRLVDRGAAGRDRAEEPAHRHVAHLREGFLGGGRTASHPRPPGRLPALYLAGGFFQAGLSRTRCAGSGPRSARRGRLRAATDAKLDAL